MRFHKKRLLVFLIFLGFCFVILINSSTKLELSKTNELTSESTIAWNKKLERYTSKYHEHRYDPSRLYSNPDDPYHDRILEQMHFVPKNYDPYKSPEKVIYMFDGLGDLPGGRKKFKIDKCPVDNCVLTEDNIKMNTAHAIFFKDSYAADFVKDRNPNQIWILYMLESPFHTSELTSFGSHVNWTATYRWDSTITAPYERFTLFKNITKNKPIVKNYAKGKTKKVAWFVSNCGAMNQRLEYAKELAKYIQVDIYGACGDLTCNRFSNTDSCSKLLKEDYKFYLAFENSNCRYYITEKFFRNALWNDVLPIVMGAPKVDYEHAAPPNSFIYAEDFETPKHLANYLHRLDRRDDEYNEYFKWKGTGELIDTKFFCRLCSLLHDNYMESPKYYKDIEKWWRAPLTCTRDKWSNTSHYVTDWSFADE